MQPTDAARPPSVVFWYRLYCGVNAFLELSAAACGGLFCVFRQPLADFYQNPDLRAAALFVDPSDPHVFLVLGVLFLAEGLVMGVIFLATFFLPRKPWAWVCHLIILALGLTGCDIVFCLPLMIYWLRADNRSYFGCDKWLK
jgi:hypothetical protein